MRPTIALGGLALAVLMAGTGLALALRDDPVPAAQVRLAAAQRGQVTASVSAAGNTVDGSRRDLAFGSAGTVTKVYVKVGAKVKKGQVLARIDGRAAREAYEAAKADLAAAQEALDKASTAAAGGTPPGCASAAGGVAGPEAPYTPHPTPTPEPGEPGPEPQPTVTVTATATVTVTATVTATPPPALDEPPATPSDRLQGIPGTGDADEAGETPQATTPGPSARPATSGRPAATGRPTTARTSKESKPRTERDSCAQDGTRQARTGGRPAKGGLSTEQATANVERAEAAVEEAADAVRGTRIVAPAAGTVLSIAGAAGDKAGTGAFITLGDLDELQVRAMVTESDVNRLKVGQKAAITLATRAGERYAGTVTAIAPAATVSGRLVQYGVTLAFDKPPSGLMLGQTASVTITTDEVKDALYVPASAVRSRPDGTQVVTVRAGGRDAAKVVRTGVRGDQYVQVVSGLSEQDQVVMPGGTSGEFPDASWPGT